MIRRWGVVILFGIALALRLAAIDWTNRPPTGDGPLYDELAVNMLNGHGYSRPAGYPTAWVAPGYPLFLAGIYAVAGHSYDAVRVAQACVGTVTAVLAMWVGMALWNRTVGWLAGALCAVHPFLIQAGTLFFTENLFLCLVAGSIALWVRFAQTGRLRHWLGMALVCSVATLTRPVLVFFPALLWGWFMIRNRRRGWRPLVRPLGLFALVWGLPVAVWTWRNYRVFHALVPLATESGDALYDSYNPVHGKIFGAADDHDPVMRAANERFPRPLGARELARSRYMREAAVRSVLEHPERLPYLLALKAATFWSVFDWEILGNGRYNVGTAVLLPWVLVGVWAWWRSRQAHGWLVASPILYMFAMGLVFYGLPRFRLTIEPLLVLVASAGLWWAWQRAAAHAVLVGGLAAWVGVNLTALRYSDAVKGSCRLVLERMGLW